jgi:divalent metal cation (Fe/Co/Zn/Cd) transporter
MKRAVRTLIRLIAAGLILFGGIEIALDYFNHRLHKSEPSIWAWVIGIFLILLGGFLIAASESLAEQLTDDIEEE